MKSKRLWTTCAMGLAMASMASIAAAVVHPPNVNPANFAYPITNPNPYFPLVPGTTFTYQGERLRTVNCGIRGLRFSP